MSYLANAGVFLIDTLFWLYIMAVMLRFILALVRADFYNPFSQFLVKITNPLLIPLRRIIPGLGGIDLASLVLMLLLQTLALVLISLIAYQSLPNIAGLMVMAAGTLINTAASLYLVLLFIQFILSWIQPHGHNPALLLIHQVNEPLLRPVRRALPPMGGLDFSIMIVGFALVLIKMLVAAPILDLGKSLL
ncbi:MAG TPA: YggT family protein [Gammaproteobacteria bacterium]|nr:YggT family protein [Gammaproteobacteria bacterium]